MSGETTVTPGKTHDESSGEATDLAKINLVSKPSVRVNEQSVGTRELIDGSVTVDKLSAGVLAQINAEAILGDGSITAAKIATGAVTKVKLNQDVLDCFVQRDTVATTVGYFLRYVNTSGVTEEVAPESLLSRKAVQATDSTSATPSTADATGTFTLADYSFIDVNWSVSFQETANDRVVGSGGCHFISTDSGATWTSTMTGCLANEVSNQGQDGVYATGTTTCTFGPVSLDSGNGAENHTISIIIADNSIKLTCTRSSTSDVIVKGISAILQA